MNYNITIVACIIANTLSIFITVKGQLRIQDVSKKSRTRMNNYIVHALETKPLYWIAVLLTGLL
jgi:hypothetical protein